MDTQRSIRIVTQELRKYFITSIKFKLNLNLKYQPVQQTPNPEAHEPDGVPPLAKHSVGVKQVPLNPFIPQHKELENRMTGNSE